MKIASFLALIVVSMSAHAQVLELAVPPFSTGETVTSVRVEFRVPLLHVSKPYFDGERFGREISSRDVDVVAINQHGWPVQYDLRVFPNADSRGFPAIRLTGSELDAAGVELGLDWVTSTGINQLRIEMRAALRRLLMPFMGGAMLTNTIEALESNIVSYIYHDS